MKRTKIKELLGMEPGAAVLAKGWVRTKRGNRQVKFIALNDGSTINNIQVVANAELFDEELFKRITTGASLAVKGELVASIGSGQASRTCASGPTPSAPSSASATRWLSPSTSSSTTRVSSISIPRSSPNPTPRAPATCSR